MQNQTSRVYAVTLFKMTEAVTYTNNAKHANPESVYRYCHHLLQQFAFLIRQREKKSETHKTENFPQLTLSSTLSKQLRKFLVSPTIGVRDKQRILALIIDQLIALSTQNSSKTEMSALPEADLSSIHDLLHNFFKILAKNNRAIAITDIAAAYQKLIDKKLGKVRVEVTGSQALNSEQKSTLQAIFQKLLQQEIILETYITDRLIGGFSFKLNQYSFDATLDKKVDELKQQLLQSSYASLAI